VKTAFTLTFTTAFGCTFGIAFEILMSLSPYFQLRCLDALPACQVYTGMAIVTTITHITILQGAYTTTNANHIKVQH